ncbi:MAG: Redoxin domain protein [Candidatus Solibacter sp.]|nr:Redoxin domain protein [Candidatus Solibacter sp.]
MKKIAFALLCAVMLTAADAPRRAPGFCLPDQTMAWRDLADYRGKIVVLEFMQSTCPHCAAFVNVLSGLQQKYAGKVAVVSVAVAPDPPAQVVQFAQSHKLPYPLLYDSGQMTMSYVRAQSVDFPTVYLIDGSGMIRGNWANGPLTKDIFEGNGLGREIDKLLGGAPATPARK